jgi:hypothetical protein
MDAAALQFSREDFAYCSELERQGVSPEVVCSGVYLGRVRKLVSDDQHRCRGEAPLPPVRSLRYFASCIAEAAKGLPSGYVDHLQKWLSRQEADPLERERWGEAEHRAETERAAAPCQDAHHCAVDEQIGDAEVQEKYKSPAETPPVPAQPLPKPGEWCHHCDGSGLRERPDDRELWDWCECSAGAKQCAEKPDAVDRANALVLRLRTLHTSSEKPASLRKSRPSASGPIDRRELMRAGDVLRAEARTLP